jgi:membrane protein DedA with SNARE-associated domain
MIHLHAWGAPLLWASLFLETAVLVGFFLPGDMALFTCGILVAADKVPVPLWVVVAGAFVAATVGDQAGYLIGERWGHRLFSARRRRFLSPRHLEAAHRFFERHGHRAVVMARFVPYARTFTPLVAGAARMPRERFTAYNVGGGFLWVASFLTIGYYAGTVDYVAAHVGLISIGIVVCGTVPVVVALAARLASRARRSRLAPVPA